MSKILLTSIIRNEARFLDTWYRQIRDLVAAQPQHQFGLSVFENDSNDGSGAKAASYDWSFLPAFHITTARLNTPFFVGGNAPLRTQLLADARNRAIYGFPMLDQMDSVLVLETDVEFPAETADRLINHEKHYGRKLDIFSGKSHPGRESKGLYDSWGTRKTADHLDWRQGDDEFEGFAPMWATFNCAVVYNAKAIREGHTFGGVNPRTGQPDCDTSVICERFRAAGYGDIAWDTNVHVYHVGG